MYLGLSPTVNDGHVVVRNDGKGNNFAQTLHTRTNLVSPDPPLEFVGDSLEPEHPLPRFRIKGRQGLDELLAEDSLPAPPLPPPAEAPAPEGLVPVEEEEEVVRVARISLEDLEGFAKELGRLGPR